MKAAVITAVNAPLEIWDLEHVTRGMDEVCANGQVLVDLRMSGICGSQLQEIEGNKGNAQFMPHLLGHEGSGVVRKVGAGVSVELIGKKVVCHWRKGEGAESFLPARYEAKGGITIGGGHVTTLCQSAVMSRNRVTVVDNDTPDELCALLGCGLSTALGTVEQEAKLKFGESVLIIGCGGLGMNLIQAARLSCAFPIIAIDVVKNKHSSCIALGANKYINAKTESISDAMNMFGLKGFDVVIDTSGNTGAIERGIQVLAGGGRFVMVGQPKPGQSFKVLDALDMFHGEGKQIIATQGGGFRPSMDIPRYVNLWKSGRLDLDGIITHHIGLDEINDGIDLVRSGQAGRIMVNLK